MISGIGLDITELDRIRKHINDDTFIRRVLTPEERECFGTLGEKRKTEFLAGRFSAKEAYAKARGTGIGGDVSFQDLTILNDPSGKPYLRNSSAGEERVHLSITHTDQTAAAFCVIESLSC
ncbi:holo-ACP synthase [Sporolactobacillus pectinivorans]|uniref:holo-ACP synthase n=1 Tax=Sporolactobacillus pectinivorans TaxID=1591408 RepID=UPI000C2681F0|nr:holo-ACP synthase [Sporolactobacillus pectinivorans]